MAAQRPLRSLVLLAAAVAVLQVLLPSSSFAGLSAQQTREVSVARAARVDPRGQTSYELWVTNPSTAMNYRVMVKETDKIKDVKTEAIEKLGFKYDFLSADDFSLSPAGKGSEDSFEESKTVKELNLIRDDEISLWFNGIVA
mmetsp:Transcript_9895/g.22160  ORF Transcript_9895/g.22160 Transcript_9895/m.22160 type:complete len:142 (+) Transcript_9895:103-528(+)|eukprot:CAMPEP_0178398406 /NCGR_PEP_ID=MMETSP0689_2-20121128/14756_1 /TAXON_ID=160604 /ORGANISM="Amphidinium massartii, Strain CS-259" /LENGTH=141 /DNA_ID=CAMNT_0020019167 /DNA_START=99 /DNA_END=524 /DNA_ORIENTATION=+